MCKCFLSCLTCPISISLSFCLNCLAICSAELCQITKNIWAFAFEVTFLVCLTLSKTEKSALCFKYLNSSTKSMVSPFYV
uniref:Secreted protein n=1 Tax=Anguilla anguilla TaxID=7936 RepID=A0A0E9T651_ANGAN